MAKTLAEQGSYLDPDTGMFTAYWPVGYPAFLAMIIKLFGYHLIVIQIIQILISAISCSLIFKLGRRVNMPERAAFLGALGFAVYPASLSMATVFLSETVYIFLIISAFIAANPNNIPNKGFSVIQLCTTGFFFVLALYVRSNAVILIPLIFSHLLFKNKLQSYLKNTLGLILVACLLIMPWALRNKHHFGKSILLSNNLGVNLYIGYHQGATGQYDEGQLYKDIAEKKLSEVESNKAFQDSAVNWVKANIGKSVILYFKKFGYLLFRDRQTVYLSFANPNPSFTIPQIILALGNNLYYLIILSGFFLSIFRLFKIREYQWLPFVLVVFTLLSFHALFFASDRFSYPSTPFIFLLAGLFFNRLKNLNIPKILPN